jgi:hypothetical protein
MARHCFDGGCASVSDYGSGAVSDGLHSLSADMDPLVGRLRTARGLDDSAPDAGSPRTELVAYFRARSRCDHIR